MVLNNKEALHHLTMLMSRDTVTFSYFRELEMKLKNYLTVQKSATRKSDKKMLND
jgi:hypothetical protein